jgi:microcystin-dependent protein
MSEPFLSEIRMVAFDYPPRGWAQCDGQILPINQYQALYSLLGTTYGGDGRTTFSLPDLRSRTPVHMGDGISRGMRLGSEDISLNLSQIPSHDHDLRAASAVADSAEADGNVYAVADRPLYQPANTSQQQVLSPGAVTSVGNGQPHNNMQPYQVVNFVIAVTGAFPSGD